MTIEVTAPQFSGSDVFMSSSPRDAERSVRSILGREGEERTDQSENSSTPLQPAYATVRRIFRRSSSSSSGSGSGNGRAAARPLAGPLLVPPLNFQTVAIGVSRSGHPNERNYEFLRRLRLKTVMYLAEDDYRPTMTFFAQREGVKILHHRITVNKEPFATMEEDRVAEALAQLLDRRNYPILVHCNKGKYRVGCLIGILRRIQGWSYNSIFEEFARFAGTKAVDEEVSLAGRELTIVPVGSRKI